MTPTRPYLVRAFFDWIVDNGMTPYLLVDARIEGVLVPSAYVRDGRIVLNLAPAAVTDLELGIGQVSFGARFAGNAHAIRLPMASIMAIYARENGQGMFFSDEDEGPDVGADPDIEEQTSISRTRPALRLVK
jgi:stringent starvation protein B